MFFLIFFGFSLEIDQQDVLDKPKKVISGISSVPPLSFFQIIVTFLICLTLTAFVCVTFYMLFKFYKESKNSPDLSSSSDGNHDASYLLSKRDREAAMFK